MKKILSTILILCIAAGIGMTLSRITMNRTSDGCIQLSDFYKLDKDTVDVLFVGSSHVYYSVNTCMLYDDHGIAGYLLASPGQPVWISYYLLEEALKTQKPQLVVYDVYTLYRKESEFGSWESLIGMKPSLTKWNAIQAVNEEGRLMDAAGAFFSFPYYHTRYANLDRQDYRNTEQIRYNGYKPFFGTISKKDLTKWENKDRTGFDQSEPITPRAESYLRKLIELCQDRDIPLLLVNAPYVNQMEEKQKAFNYIRTIAEEYGIPFIDSCHHLEEMQIDFAKDALEPSHLNYYGSLKYTAYLAQWMEQNCKLPDRRGNEQYQHWAETSRMLQHAELNGRALKEIHAPADYRKSLQGLESCVVAVYQNPGGESFLYEDGKLVFQGIKGQDYFKHLDLGSSDLAVFGSREGTVRVLLDKKEYTFVEHGVNVLVYDKAAGRVIDGVGFDEDAGFQMVRKQAGKKKNRKG